MADDSKRKRTRTQNVKRKAFALDSIGTGTPRSSMTSAAQKPDYSEHRDNKGRFTVGNPGGSGSNFFKRIHEYRKAIYSAATPNDLFDVMKSMIEKAKMGDVLAARFVYAYSVGEPLRYDQEKLDAATKEELEKVLDVIPMEKLIALAK